MLNTRDTFNLTLAIEVLANIEASQQFPHACPVGWGQSYWAMMQPSPEMVEGEYGMHLADLDLIYDSETGLPMGRGSCGTSMCFAGWTVTLSGIKLLWAGDASSMAADRTADGRRIDIVARALLGIPKLAEGHWDYDENFPSLFSAGRTLDGLYWEVASLSGVDEDTIRIAVKQQIAEGVVAMAGVPQS